LASLLFKLVKSKTLTFLIVVYDLNSILIKCSKVVHILCYSLIALVDGEIEK